MEMPCSFKSFLISFQSVWALSSLFNLLLLFSSFFLTFFRWGRIASSAGDHLPVQNFFALDLILLQFELSPSLTKLWGNLDHILWMEPRYLDLEESREEVLAFGLSWVHAFTFWWVLFWWALNVQSMWIRGLGVHHIPYHPKGQELTQLQQLPS